MSYGCESGGGIVVEHRGHVMTLPAYICAVGTVLVRVSSRCRVRPPLPSPPSSAVRFRLRVIFIHPDCLHAHLLYVPGRVYLCMYNVVTGVTGTCLTHA